ncbi:MAG: ABC transporter permease [Oscillospiraceae bacterium]
MHKYIFKRLLMMVPVLIGITFIIFMILNMTPGDPALIILGNEATDETVAQLREELGLNDPLLLQYGRYMLGLVRGDLGYSYLNNRAIFPSIMERLPTTLSLAFLSLLVSVVVAIPLGIISATRQYSVLDSASMVLCLIGVSIPSFWLALMLILFFSVNLSILPSGGLNNGLVSYILPAITLATSGAASMARQTRSSMLEVIRQDYIRTARAKGVQKNKVLIRHALKNAIMPVITLMGLTLGRNVGGAVVVESIFTLPGTGRLLLEGIRSKDIPMVMGCVVVLSILISIANLLVDIVYGFVDPRLKAEYK